MQFATDALEIQRKMAVKQCTWYRYICGYKLNEIFPGSTKAYKGLHFKIIFRISQSKHIQYILNKTFVLSTQNIKCENSMQNKSDSLTGLLGYIRIEYQVIAC